MIVQLVIVSESNTTLLNESVADRPVYESLIAAVWFAGAAFVTFAVLSRAWRMERLIRRSRFGDDDIVQQVNELGRDMGLRQLPNVRFVRAKISPLLWAFFRRPVLLLPIELWTNLNDDEKTAVLKHELAHFQRLDHWVRPVEALATITHWWCPILWWTKRELHRYEERCCDALAASTPNERAALAHACLRSTDFIGGRTSWSGALGATPMGGFEQLKDRIDFILEGPRCPDGTSKTAKLLVAVGLAVTPVVGHGSDSPSIESTWANAQTEKNATHVRPADIDDEDAVNSWKILAFEKLTGADLAEVVSNEVSTSLSKAVTDLDLPETARKELSNVPLPQSRSELTRFLRSEGYHEMIIDQYVESVINKSRSN